MGSTVNLLDAWEPYKAARTVLQASLDSAAVKQMTSKHATKMEVSPRRSIRTLVPAVRSEHMSAIERVSPHSNRLFCF